MITDTDIKCNTTIEVFLWDAVGKCNVSAHPNRVGMVDHPRLGMNRSNYVRERAARERRVAPST